MLADPEGPASLYYAGSPRIISDEYGMVTGSGSNIYIIEYLGDAYIDHRYPGHDMYIRTRNAANNSMKTGVKLIPEGATELYHDGTKKVETADYGFSFGANTISGTGDIYCNDIYTSSGTVHIGVTELSSNGAELLVDGQPVAGTGIQSGCYATLTGNQSVGADSTEQIEFDTTNYDLNNEFNTSTYRFTAKQAGYYLISLHHVYSDGIPLDDYYQAFINKNGSLLWRTKFPPGDQRTQTGLDITGIEHLEVDDYITADTQHTNVAARNLSSETALFIWRLNSTPADLQGYYTKSEVDNMITTLSGVMQAQTDELLSL